VQDGLADVMSGIASAAVGASNRLPSFDQWHHRPVLSRLRAMPPGIRIFLGYAFLVLGLIGVSLRFVVDQAISAPLSLPGIVVMVLLAYTIFTTTLVLQRKEAARGLALGLATLTIPAVPLLLLAALPLYALIVALLAGLLFFGLTRPDVRAYLNEP
jgi:MFS superfamily sulfate permease-like transporter